MKINKKMCLGIVLSVTPIWIFSWVESMLPKDHWTNLPMFLSSILFFCVGIVVIIHSFVDED